MREDSRNYVAIHIPSEHQDRSQHSRHESYGIHNTPTHHPKHEKEFLQILRQSLFLRARIGRFIPTSAYMKKFERYVSVVKVGKMIRPNGTPFVSYRKQCPKETYSETPLVSIFYNGIMYPRHGLRRIEFLDEYKYTRETYPPNTYQYGMELYNDYSNAVDDPSLPYSMRMR